MNDPSPRLNSMLPDPAGKSAAAYEIRLLTDRISRLPAKMGMSLVDAATVGSEPNLIYAKPVVAFVTTTESPPPVSRTFADTLPADTLTVPVGRKGLTEPSGMAILLLCLR
jgi:hypothetical protein